MTTVYLVDGKIKNPKATTIIIKEVITSDGFSGAGELLGRSTDCEKGGDAFTWSKIGSFNAVNSFRVQGGVLQTVNTTNDLGVISLPINRKNIFIEFKVVKLDPKLEASSGMELVYLDARRVSEDNNMYRLAFTNSKFTLFHRNLVSTPLAQASVKEGDKISWLLKDDLHNIYVNDILVISLKHQGKLGVGGIGFSHGDLKTSGASAEFDNLIIYSV